MRMTQIAWHKEPLTLFIVLEKSKVLLGEAILNTCDKVVKLDNACILYRPFSTYPYKIKIPIHKSFIKNN